MKILAQIAVVFGICLVGEAIALVLPFPFPGSVISMILVFLLLLFKILKVDHIRQKLDFLLKNMAFFFIPPAIEIISQFDAFKSSILPILIICVVSTLLTFFASMYTVRAVILFQQKRSEKAGKHV